MYEIINTDRYKKIQEELGLTTLAAKVVSAYNYNEMKDRPLMDPFLYKDMYKVCEKIKSHLNNKIMIYGDYDADGVCATSILVQTLIKLGNEPGYYIPNRYKEGYGLSKDLINSIASKGYNLLITVDCGIKNNEEIKLAKDLGMEVIVLDHHELSEVLPSADLILHPTYSNFTKYNMCGASVAFYVSKALLGVEDEYLLALAGIATLGDVMPLVEENRLLVQKTLTIINKNRYIHFDLLTSYPKEYDQNTLNYSLIPKINAVGRICKNNEANKLVKYFTSDNKEEIRSLAAFIESSNEKRKSLTKGSFAQLDKDYSDKKIIIIHDENILEGIAGLIASYFVNKYNVPAIVFTSSEDKLVYKGSGRSTDSISLINLLDELNKYLLQYGGHQKAAGISISEINFETFVNKAQEVADRVKIVKKPIQVIKVEPYELTYEALNELITFGPFGEGNKEPLFLLKDVPLDDLRLSRDGKHILSFLHAQASLVAFNMASIINKDNKYYDFIFSIENSTYKEGTISCKSVDCFISRNFD